MINQFSRRIATVLIDNSECGTVDHILHTQFLTDRLDKGSLTGPHRTIEGKDRTIIQPGDKLLSRLMDLIQTFYFQYAHSIRVYSLYGLQSS